MKIIREMLDNNAAESYNTANNFNRTESQLVWEHRLASGTRLNEACVSVAVSQAMGNKDHKLLDKMFDQLSTEAEREMDVTNAKLNYLGRLRDMAVEKGSIHPNKSTKVHVVPTVSTHTVWVPGEDGAEGTEHAFHDKARFMDYLQHELSLEQLVFGAKSAIMSEMGKVVTAALQDISIDNEFITSKIIKHNKRGDMKWGSVMGAVFWMGLAYKLHNGGTQLADGSIRTFASTTAWQRAKLDNELQHCEDEQFEVGHYLLERQADIEERERKVQQYELIAPYAERMFGLIDYWNAVEEWSYEDNEFDKIILNKVPKEQSLAEKRRALEDIYAVMAKTEEDMKRRAAKPKGAIGAIDDFKPSQSFYDQLRGLADYANKGRRQLSHKMTDGASTALPQMLTVLEVADV